MKLIPYERFGQLRLRKWYPNDEFLEDSDSWNRLIREEARGITFLRSMEKPAETFSIQLDLLDFIEDFRFEILNAIGLPLKPGQSTDEVKALLGEPDLFRRSRRRRLTWHEFKSTSPEPYVIACMFHDDKGLANVTVQRMDIPFPKCEDDESAEGNRHEFLGEFEVLPDNIKSPESPVSKVTLLMESNNFRYLIRIPRQEGMVVDGATLNIRNTEKQETSRIPLCLHTIDQQTGSIELSGWIDKELLFRTFVQISKRDQIHNTSEYIFIEFDQWYGKYIR